MPARAEVEPLDDRLREIARLLARAAWRAPSRDSSPSRRTPDRAGARAPARRRPARRATARARASSARSSSSAVHHLSDFGARRRLGRRAASTRQTSTSRRLGSTSSRRLRLALRVADSGLRRLRFARLRLAARRPSLAASRLAFAVAAALAMRVLAVVGEVEARALEDESGAARHADASAILPHAGHATSGAASLILR